MIKTLVNQPDKPIANLIFAHGAGAGQNSEFMQSMALAIAELGVRVIRFNFCYMQIAEHTHTRRSPERVPKLMDYYQQVIEQVAYPEPLFIGGKSMGGRVASMILDNSSALAGICMGYPFHPPKKPEKCRTEHLLTLAKPLLILQGERDTFGTPAEIAQYALPKPVQLEYLADGDHSFKPRVKSGYSQQQHILQAAQHSVAFINNQIA